MNHNTNTELVDIHFIYDLVNGNGRVAVWFYGERYPTRRQGRNQNFAEHGSFKDTIDDTPVSWEMDLVS
ncbi:hypothetical protein TNCV_1666231 [Trichonephila clavipes]|nr:hypothetical protein TNCV_1666231 [Trichonephila clavipes]